MKTAVLLGAGASKDAGIPTAIEMTPIIYDRIRAAFGDHRAYSRALSTVIGGLIFQQGARGDSPYWGLNIEEVFAAVQMLGDRDSIQAAPFISSWHSSLDKLEREPVRHRDLERLWDLMANGIMGEIKDKGFITTWDSPFYEATFAKGDYIALLEEVIERRARSGPGAVFRDLSEYMIIQLRDMVWIEPDSVERDVSYLAPLLTLGSKPLSIYTLNYDNTIERVCLEGGVPISVGITESGELAYDDGAAVRLGKLHGSIDWVKERPSQDTEHPIPMGGVRLATPDEMTPEGYKHPPAIIFGQGNKLTADGPYLELLRWFRTDLEEHAQLLIVGYSFRDDHINHYIAAWFNGDTKRRIIIVNGNGFAKGKDRSPFAETLLEWGDHWHEDRIVVIPEYATAGLPLAAAEAMKVSNGEAATPDGPR